MNKEKREVEAFYKVLELQGLMNKNPLMKGKNKDYSEGYSDGYAEGLKDGLEK